MELVVGKIRHFKKFKFTIDQINKICIEHPQTPKKESIYTLHNNYIVNIFSGNHNYNLPRIQSPQCKAHNALDAYNLLGLDNLRIFVDSSPTKSIRRIKLIQMPDMSLLKINECEDEASESSICESDNEYYGSYDNYVNYDSYESDGYSEIDMCSYIEYQMNH